jgi:hypothetical protein
MQNRHKIRPEPKLNTHIIFIHECLQSKARQFEVAIVEKKKQAFKQFF